jgi:hypothetical protein
MFYYKNIYIVFGGITIAVLEFYFVNIFELNIMRAEKKIPQLISKFKEILIHFPLAGAFLALKR